MFVVLYLFIPLWSQWSVPSVCIVSVQLHVVSAICVMYGCIVSVNLHVVLAIWTMSVCIVSVNLHGVLAMCVMSVCIVSVNLHGVLAMCVMSVCIVSGHLLLFQRRSGQCLFFLVYLIVSHNSTLIGHHTMCNVADGIFNSLLWVTLKSIWLLTSEHNLTVIPSCLVISLQWYLRWSLMQHYVLSMNNSPLVTSVARRLSCLWTCFPDFCKHLSITWHLLYHSVEYPAQHCLQGSHYAQSTDVCETFSVITIVQISAY